MAESVIAREETATDGSAASVTAAPRVPLSTHLNYSLGMMAPSALVVLLTSISLGRTALGLVLIAAFSAGLAASLIGGYVWFRVSESSKSAVAAPVTNTSASAPMSMKPYPRPSWKNFTVPVRRSAAAGVA